MLLFISTCAKGLILRMWCETYADFTIFKREKGLDGSPLKEISNTNDRGCMRLCVQHPKCRSYNVERTASKCELNSKALGDENALLVSRPGWIYKSTDYSSTLVCGASFCFSITIFFFVANVYVWLLLLLLFLQLLLLWFLVLTFALTLVLAS